ncbi:Protein CBG20082 [Caenorhabditis briggsae]|nr:Protein CBG20082 [Caenorhabditis briggsae]CAP37188.2 Protein CBG20082 [Caenorhabditis briggsae]
MEHYTTNPLMEEINAGTAGIVSLIANGLLIYLTSKVKTYSDTVRLAQYYSCIFRLAFSLLVFVTAPTIMYISEVKALYIVKGGIDMSRELGNNLINLFLVLVVTSCTGPTVQYLQVAYLLSNPALKNHTVLRLVINAVPLLVAIPTSIFIYLGYIPTSYEMDISESLIQEITGHEDSSFLIAPEEKVGQILVDLEISGVLKIMMPETGTMEYDVWARICTFFMFTAMVLSVLVVVACFSHMQKMMSKKKSVTTQQSLKSQKQLNLLLMVQFIFPFITIHIPFYTAFILPYADIEFTILSSNLPYLFSWCPAINPILVICMVKNVRDTLLGSRKNTPNTGVTFTSSHALAVKNSVIVKK